MNLRSVFWACWVSCCLLVGSGAEESAYFEGLGAQVRVEEGEVTGLNFRKAGKLAPEVWQRIGALSGLRSLTVYGCQHSLDDTAAGELAKLKQLTTLSTEGAWLTDEGLAQLAGMKSLQRASFFHLSYRMEEFTGAGFAAWRVLPDLKMLTVAGMSMGDEGFRAIAELQGLESLRVWHTHRTEASNGEIAKLAHLKSLKLGQRLPRKGEPVCLSDASLPVLAGMESLEVLQLSEGRFSLAGLRALQKARNLRSLEISQSEVTEETVAALREVLEGVKVEFKPLTEKQKAQLERYLR
ncbi:MAG: hypothetical protein ACQKBY_13120 [Verrucomicrobiales bacterium]